MPSVESPFDEVPAGFRPVKAWRAVEEEEADLPPRPPVDWRRRLRIALLVAAPLLVLLGIWWCFQPRGYHLVGTYPGTEVTVIPSRQGFLLRETRETFVLRDWVRGAECWRLTAQLPAGAQLNYSLSPSGRYFALLATTPYQALLTVWDAGKLTCTVPFRGEMAPLRRVKALDDNRYFVWWYALGRSQAYLISPDHVPPRTQFLTSPLDRYAVARGQLLPWNNADIAPDGKTMVAAQGTTFEYATIEVQHGVMSLSHRYTGFHSISILRGPGYVFNNCLFNGGKVLTDNGTLYDQSGLVANANGWRHESVSPEGNYTYQSRQNLAQVYSPLTGEQWGFQVKGTHFGGDTAGDGRYALAWYKSHAPRVLEQIPPVQHLLAQWPQDTLALYERPGRLRAAMRLNVRQWWGERNSAPAEWWWWPSPDGHAVVINMADMTKSKCMLFRW